MNQKVWLVLCALAFVLLCYVCVHSHDQHAAAPSSVPAPIPASRVEGRVENGQIMLSGAVPSAQLKSAIAGRAQSIFGAARVTDNLTVDPALSKPAWGPGIANLSAVLGSRLSNGSFLLSPDSITLRGQVAGEDAKAGIVRAATDSAGPGVRIVDELTVTAKTTEQSNIDDFLKGKVIEFGTASSVITQQGRNVLDATAIFLRKSQGKTIEISGHTDNEGDLNKNMKLSIDRANAVKRYLLGKGLEAARLNTAGYGPARPVGDNATAEGRRQNRRIEFAIQ